MTRRCLGSRTSHLLIGPLLILSLQPLSIRMKNKGTTKRQSTPIPKTSNLKLLFIKCLSGLLTKTIPWDIKRWKKPILLQSENPEDFAGLGSISPGTSRSRSRPREASGLGRSLARRTRRSGSRTTRGSAATTRSSGCQRRGGTVDGSSHDRAEN